MQQYLEIKDRYPNEIVFFRLGDFYEMFFEDAIQAAPILEVALTKRQTTPMCGVPHHSSSGYMAKLLKAGRSVALAEQLEDPKKTKGMVKRDVVRVLTPGTVIEDELLPSKANNFLVAVSIRQKSTKEPGSWAVAAADVSTGRQWQGSFEADTHWNQLKAQLASLNPSEVLLVGEQTQAIAPLLFLKGITRFEPNPGTGASLMESTTAALHQFLNRNQNGSEKKLLDPEPLPVGTKQYLFLDESAIRHLELVESADPGKNGPTLFRVLDRTSTALGSRLLRWSILHPLTETQKINSRLSQVGNLLDAEQIREEISSVLVEIADVERILSRTQSGQVSPRDLAGLRHSLKQAPLLIKALKKLQSDTLQNQFENECVDCLPPNDLIDMLDNQLADNPPMKITDGGVIKDGFHAPLDELRMLKKAGRKWIAEMEASEKEKTKITTLKVGYNDVFGYYLEVSKSHLAKVPEDWIRKQTLANAERFITPALKDQEEKILGAQEKIEAMEADLFSDLVQQVSAYAVTISKIAGAIAHIDFINSLAHVSAENQFVRPTIVDGDETHH